MNFLCPEVNPSQNPVKLSLGEDLMHGTMPEHVFKNDFSRTIFHAKYSKEYAKTWPELAKVCVDDVCGGILSPAECEEIQFYISTMKFIPGGRYLAYAGRDVRFWNNCYLFLSREDTREDWADLAWKAERALMTGGGIGNDYTVYRGRGSSLSRTGGVASGAVSAMKITNDQGREVMQGGGRRSAIYGSLLWSHPDAEELLAAKNWHEMLIEGAYVKDLSTDHYRQMTVADAKMVNPNFQAPLDYTNVSLNYDTRWLVDYQTSGDPGEVFRRNIHQAIMTGEPGFSFNFFEKEHETGRNACTEVTTSDDSDVCNLGSINLANIHSLGLLRQVVRAATKFLLCGTIRADLPFDRIRQTREKNRRLGLGLMGVHEWLLQRGYRYEVVPELHDWLAAYKYESDVTSERSSTRLGISRPVASRAIAPTGTIGILAGTTTGIEPLFAVAYKRRYLKDGHDWVYQYVVDGTAQSIIDETGCDPESIESALDLSSDPERRIKFQYDVQQYVDQAISSTINLPNPNTIENLDTYITDFGDTVAKYAHGLRGLTCYPDGSRGGQPLTRVPYKEAVSQVGIEFKEHDVCDISGKGGFCGS